jgi:hypothetical protein
MIPGFSCGGRSVTSRAADDARWWGQWTVEEGEAVRWRVGPLTLQLSRSRDEWRVAYGNADDPLDSSLEISGPVKGSEPDASLTVNRFAARGESGHLQLLPALADRPVINRPQEPFYVLPDDEVALYISTPLWVRVEAGEPAALLQELPTHRPSDTWFGPSTREGEMCYAARTHCRLRFEELPFRPHRAITPIVLRNQAAETLLLERLSVPVRRLSLYSADQRFLWTERLTMEWTDPKEGLARADLEEGAPSEAGPGAELVRGPRDAGEESFMVQAFSAFFA